MNDISITDYLGPGVYLLHNYPEKTEGLIAEKGYKVHNYADLIRFEDIIDHSKVNILLTNDNHKSFDDYVNIVRISAGLQVNKIVINIFIEKGNSKFYQDFIDISSHLGYSLDTVFYVLNPGYDESFQNDQTLRVVLNYSQQYQERSNKYTHETSISEKNIVNTFPYIRPGDRVLLICKNIKLNASLTRIISDHTKASEIQFCTLSDIESIRINKNSFHFIIIDKYADNELIDPLIHITSSLLPAGRCVFFHPDQNIINTTGSYDLQPEAYLFYEHHYLKTQIHQGEQITNSPELCVFMKNPSAKTDFSYQETIYSYSHPPKNLLAFARDYDNPWLIRGIVEFPFRNRSAYHLRQYSYQVLEQSAPESPDYAAALAVLGYQLLSSGDNSDNIVDKISNFCSRISQTVHPSPHQYRWFISLSTLLGLICNKNNDKINALIHFSHAANSCINNFSPSIGTKILQSLYLQSVILISLNKISCAEIIIDRGIKRGIQLLYQRPEELVGKISQPFNFVLYIYHDILDWLIKLVNIKNAIPGRKYNLANIDNNNTWSALLHERMRAINNMSQMIDERDKTIHDQQCLIDERDKTIYDQQRLIDERDETILSQKNLIDERDRMIVQQKELLEKSDNIINQKNQKIDNLNDESSSKEKKLNELQDKNAIIVVLNNEKDLRINQLSADLERANSILRKINSKPLIRQLLRILNIK
ncbi:hypothetical protein [Klebsiella oxytoca]|uniref:Uncharacterized protein n=1 Tax=Klebsiella oxytoca TaxID=571 RepID=A0A6B8MZX7_KLEOX|nr:hypothetical protein [Klebsiella oxytoca]QGN38798.1 hypothetical protein GJ746_16525 [Klebsiella oxytoca]